MRQCPNCGASFPQDLSFCPKCGTVFRGTTTNSQFERIRKKEERSSLEHGPVQRRKSRPAWQYVIAVLFFPITLTALVINSKRFKVPAKVALIIGIWVFTFVASGLSKNEAAPTEEVVVSSETGDTNVTQVAEETKTEENDSSFMEQDQENEIVKYHRNKAVNQFITSYNEVSEYPISPDAVGTSNGGNTGSFQYDGGPNIAVTHNSSGQLMIRLLHEDETDGKIVYIFEDICRAIDPTLSDEDISGAINEIRSNDYSYYAPYQLHNLKCSYNSGPVGYATEGGNGIYKYQIDVIVDNY
jgi:hypothetical protein